MSDVEKFWNAIVKKWPNPVAEYNQLQPMSQMMLVQAVNIIVEILDRERRMK